MVSISQKPVNGIAELGRWSNMNTTQPETLLQIGDRNRVPARRGKLDDELEKSEKLEELAQLFFAAKRHQPNAPLPAHC
jgi:hypothetical protein